MMNELREDDAPFVNDAGFAPLDGYSFLRLTGKDRASFLHGLCTNDVKRLETGQGCEAFFTTVQGKTLAFGWIFAEDDALHVELAAADGTTVFQQLDKYLIREDVQLLDRSAETAAWLIAGPKAYERLAVAIPLTPFATPVASVRGTLGAVAVSVHRLLTAPLHLHVVAERASAEQVEAAFESLGVSRCSPAAAEVRRIECGLPHVPEEVSIDHLPQELDRNASAISFTKGCYLGQETVARLDALGHVNRRLMGLLIPGSQPFSAGIELLVEGKVAARVTSSVYSPARRQAIALAYVRRGFDRPGQQLESPAGPVEVTTLPFVTHSA